ncbi:MAG: hypothetical protein HW414_411 [Dehalococcoidia bacterium]|nr:hypothetical protein [Dehalococcoidia bacterium]
MPFDRRRFLKSAGVLIASAGVAGALQACQKAMPAPTPTPTPTPTPPPTPMPSPAPEPLRPRIARLLRRAGFGASKTELDRFAAMGLDATVSYLLDYEKVSDADLDLRLESQKLDLSKLPNLQRWWTLRMLYTQRPLLEKMTLFWHGLLTSGISRVGRAEFMMRQNQLFRQQALGSFPDLLNAISRDPAMLIWLDSQSNQKSAPNENFAREIMELFTMGVGNYSEQDVRESARAFTGWFLRRNEFSFEPSQHDNGVKTFLGESGTFSGDDIVDIIIKKPATSDFICRKLFSFFGDARAVDFGGLSDGGRAAGST